MGTKNEPGVFDCYEHAEPDEPMFVLLARDRTAPDVVREWALARRAMLNQRGNETAMVDEVLTELDQIAEALRCADAMEAWRAEHRR